MPKQQSLRSRALVIATAVLAAALAAAMVSVATGAAARTSKTATLKLKCPKKVRSGRQVTCVVRGKSLRGPAGRPGPRGLRGVKGARGARGQKGARGPRGATGSPGVAGYEIVSNLFSAVAVPGSEAGRGLSEALTVRCPGGKRVISGGIDLGTAPAQAAAQRVVSVSRSGPDGSGAAWVAQLFNAGAADVAIDARVFAVCARVV